MKKLINVKFLSAEPMTLGEYNEHRGWTIPTDEDPGEPGFLLKDNIGLEIWHPKESFEDQSFHIEAINNTITQADVDSMIADTFVKTIGNKTTFMQVTLRNGFTLEETSSCVDPANHNEAMGAELCLGKIKDKIWFLLGFLLQSALYGFDRRESDGIPAAKIK